MHRGPDTFLHQVVGGRWRVLEVVEATADQAAFRVETLEDERLARLELWDRRHVEGRGELARFEREARTLSRLRHERCLSIVAFGAHEGCPFLVSELPDGKSLRDELGNPELTVAAALALGLQLCEGLRHLHRHGVAHRALLPENVWATETPAGGRLKMGPPRIGHTTAAPEATRRRLFLPPERSAGKPDRRADLYAAGMLLYVMCTGREPAADAVAAIASGAPVPAPRAVSPERAISKELERVILRAVAPSPGLRFETADELLAALQSVGAHLGNPKRRAGQRPPGRTAMVAAAFAVVAVLGAGALRSSGGHGPRVSASAEAAQPRSPPAKAAVAPPAFPPAPMAARPTEPAPEPAAEARSARVPPIATTASGEPSRDERSEIWSLLESGRLDEGATRLKPLVARAPDAAWPRFALGVLYYRKYWRGDSVRQWKLALAQDPELRLDPQFGAYLCFMLDDAWQEAGMAELLDRLGAGAEPLLDRCVESAKSPRMRASASRALARLRRSRRG